MAVAALRVLLLVAVTVLVVCGGTTTAVGAPTTPPVDAAPATQWQWPLGGQGQTEPPVARPFRPPPQPWAAGHRGVDLVGSPGVPVRAPASGVVAYAGPLAGRGVLTIRVGDLRTTLEPVQPVVHAGDRVRAGDMVGHLQTSASHCLPRSCLHWGALRGEEYLDPLAQLGARPADIVLLPLTGPGHTGPRPPVGGFPASLDASTPSEEAAAAIEFARRQLGDPYVWAATGPSSWDCSGLTMAAWAAAGRSLPRNSAAQYAASTPVSKGELQPGDLVFWSAVPGAPTTIFHVGLYIGDGEMIHAPRPGTTVRVESIHSWAAPTFFGRV